MWRLPLRRPVEDPGDRPRSDADDYARAVALAWVIHLVGDIHQPLYATGRNSFKVKYRGQTTCPETKKVELHSVWDDCLVDEAETGTNPRNYAVTQLGKVTIYTVA